MYCAPFSPPLSVTRRRIGRRIATDHAALHHQTDLQASIATSQVATNAAREGSPLRLETPLLLSTALVSLMVGTD